MFEKGNTHSKGRPVGSKNRSIPIGDLIDSFEKITQDKYKKPFIEYLCERALTNDKLLSALIRLMVEKQVDVVDVNYNNEWATKTPADIVDDMDECTVPQA